jgi:hypothetical protein
VDVTYYEPTSHGYEATIKRRLEEWRERLKQADPDDQNAGNE